TVVDPAAGTSPPAAPGGLQVAVASATQLSLSWNDVSGESGFKVERSPDGVSGWVQVSTTAAGVTALGNGALAPGTTYYYRVRAPRPRGGRPRRGGGRRRPPRRVRPAVRRRLRRRRTGGRLGDQERLVVGRRRGAGPELHGRRPAAQGRGGGPVLPRHRPGHG